MRQNSEESFYETMTDFWQEKLILFVYVMKHPDEETVTEVLPLERNVLKEKIIVMFLSENCSTWK